MTRRSHTGWFSLFAGIVAAALVTGAAIMLILTGPSHVNSATIFLFAFVYALAAGLILGLPLMGELARERRFSWWVAGLIGGVAALVPGIIFIAFLASCEHIPKVFDMAMCVDGVRTLNAWLLSGALLAGMAAVGALAGLTGYLVYIAIERTIFQRYWVPGAP